MIQVKQNKSNNNPFYGLKNCLQLFQNIGQPITERILNNCYDEVKNNKEHREMFFSLLFSMGDITARHHNIFKKRKIDSGGNANREGFFTAFMWMKRRHFDQFIKFLNAGLFNEYTCFDLLFRSRIKTNKNGIQTVYNVFEDSNYRKELLDYIYKVINSSNIFNKFLIAKFLTPPRLSRRSGHTKMLDETKGVMQNKALFLAELSKLMHWDYKLTINYANFKGYREWRKQYNQELESVLFSSGKINEFDCDEFLEWFDKLPAQARFRVKNRLLYSKLTSPVYTAPNGVKVNTAGIKDSDLKYPKLKNWYYLWEKCKEDKQLEQRFLEEKIRQGNASDEDKLKLKEVKKEAKVNVGATNFNDIFNDICRDNIDELKVESFINKVNLPYNNLVIIDDSGSMGGAPYRFASFLASVCLVKNPDDDGRNLLGFFDYSSRFYSYIDEKNTAPNSLLKGTIVEKQKIPFVNPNLSFMENYRNIDSFCRAHYGAGSTNIAAIPEGFKIECDNNPFLLDNLKKYPIWTIISDGEWNNQRSPEASINDFMRRCEDYFGFKPYIIAIDVKGSWGFHPETADITRFSGIDNFMYVPSNPAQIEQILTNFKDMDVFDVYTPLQSLYRSNRYELVRNNTL